MTKDGVGNNFIRGEALKGALESLELCVPIRVCCGAPACVYLTVTERGGEERPEARWRRDVGLDLTMDNDLELSVLVSHQLDDFTESCSPRVVPVPAAQHHLLEMKILHSFPRPTWVEIQQSEF